jgi:hypothetical protein
MKEAIFVFGRMLMGLFAVVTMFYIIIKYAFYGEQPDLFVATWTILFYMMGFLKHEE